MCDAYDELPFSMRYWFYGLRGVFGLNLFWTDPYL